MNTGRKRLLNECRDAAPRHIIDGYGHATVAAAQTTARGEGHIQVTAAERIGIHIEAAEPGRVPRRSGGFQASEEDGSSKMISDIR